MTKYILHGGYTSTPNDLNKNFYAEITKDLEDRATVLLIYFARDPEDWDELFEQDKARILETTSCDELNIVCATEDDFGDQIKRCDALYIRGGDTEKLIDILRKYPTFARDVEGKVCAGSSAGAYVLSRYYYTNSQNKVLEGLGLVPVRIACHYQSQIHPTSKGSDPVSMLNEYNEGLELVLLKDHEWKVLTS